MRILAHFHGAEIKHILNKHDIESAEIPICGDYSRYRYAYIQEKQLLPLLGIIRLSGYQIEKTDKDYTFHIRSSSWAEG